MKGNTIHKKHSNPKNVRCKRQPGVRKGVGQTLQPGRARGSEPRVLGEGCSRLRRKLGVFKEQQSQGSWRHREEERLGKGGTREATELQLQTLALTLMINSKVSICCSNCLFLPFFLRLVFGHCRPHSHV